MNPYSYPCFTLIFIILSCLCEHLLEKSRPLGPLVCDDFLCFCHFFHMVFSGQVWYFFISISNLLHFFIFIYIFFNRIPYTSAHLFLN